MSIGRSKERQRSMWLSYDQIHQSKGHVFYQPVEKLSNGAQWFEDIFKKDVMNLGRSKKQLRSLEKIS